MAWEKLIRSGSNAHLNQVTASFFSGSGASIFGIVSSSYAISASYAANVGTVLTGNMTYTDLAVTGSTVTLTTTETFITSASITLSNISSSVLILGRADLSKDILAGTISTSIRLRRNYTGTQIGVDGVAQAQTAGLNNFGPVTVFGIDTPYSSSLSYSMWGRTETANGTTTDRYHLSLIELRGPKGDTPTTAATASYYQEQRSVGLTIDGGGTAITTGIKGDITIPFNGYISAWYLTADQAGSIVVDVWKDALANFPPTVANTIAGSEKPTLSSVAFNSDTNLTTWTKQVTSGDVIRFNVDSATTVTRVNLVIKILT